MTEELRKCYLHTELQQNCTKCINEMVCAAAFRAGKHHGGLDKLVVWLDSFDYENDVVTIAQVRSKIESGPGPTDDKSARVVGFGKEEKALKYCQQYNIKEDDPHYDDVINAFCVGYSIGSNDNG